ncbi:MAG: hypothetical protein V4757_16135 [Pseudomonadota bacterium]
MMQMKASAPGLRFTAPPLVLLAALACAPQAQAQNVAQCIKQSASCAGNIAKTSLAALEAGGEILEFAAKNPECIADMISYNFVTIGISTSMVALAATGVIQKDGGSYYKGVYGTAARPIIEKVSAIVPVPALADLLRDTPEADLGFAFSQAAVLIPMPSVNAYNLDMQLKCGGAVAGAGMQMVADVKRVIGHAKGAVKSCSAAAGCFKDVLVGIVKDPVGAASSAGEFVLDGADAVIDAINPYSCKNPSVESYFAANFKPQVNSIAWELAWGNQDAYGPASRALVDACVKSFDSCNSDKDTAERQCVVMSSGAVQTDGNGWIAGKGLEQLVRTRELELAIPKMLAVEAKWADAQQKPRIDKTVAAVFGDMPPEMKAWLKPPSDLVNAQPAHRAQVVRKILGVTRADGKFGVNEKVVLPNGSIGALMLGYVPVEGPKQGRGYFKAGQLYRQYYPDTGNEKLLRQIDTEAEKPLAARKSQLISLNGNNWNLEYAKLHADRMRARAAACKNADRKCVDDINAGATLREVSLRGMGAAENYAGLGAWGLQHPAYLKYLANVEEGMGAANKAVNQSMLVVMPDPATQSAGIVITPPAGAGPGSAAAMTPPKPLMSQQQPGSPGTPGVPLPALPQALPPSGNRIGMPAVPGMLPGGTANAPPSGGKMGMPALPGMVAGNVPRSAPALNPGVAAAVAPPPPPVTAPGNAKAPGVSPGVAAALAPPPPPPAPAPLVALAPPPPPSPQFNPSAQAATAALAAAAAKPFDLAAYKAEREPQINARWSPQCPATGNCRMVVTALAGRQAHAEAQALAAGNPDPKVKPAVLLMQQQSDAKFEAQFREAIAPPPPPPPPPPKPQAMTDPAADAAKQPVKPPNTLNLPKGFVK